MRDFDRGWDGVWHIRGLKRAHRSRPDGPRTIRKIFPITTSIQTHFPGDCGLGSLNFETLFLSAEKRNKEKKSLGKAAYRRTFWDHHSLGGAGEELTGASRDHSEVERLFICETHYGN